MKRIMLLLIFSALLMGCVSEQEQQNITTPMPTEQPVKEPINDSDINETLSYLQEIESIDFNL